MSASAPQDRLAIALAQLNPTVGDIPGNVAKLKAARAEVAREGADLVVFTELYLSGYPPEDLVQKPAFLEDICEAIEEIAKETADGGPAVLVGTPWPEEGWKPRNSAVLIEGGAVRAVRHKVELPNYGIFDELRLFEAGPMPEPIEFRGVKIGVPICEDIWAPRVCAKLKERGAELLLVPNGSPFQLDKWDLRLDQAKARVRETGLALVYLNQMGGQDEIVFDGSSLVLNPDCSMPLHLPAWEEAVTVTQWRREGDRWICADGDRHEPEAGLAAAYQAVMWGLRDYVRKNRFPGVLLGLSGGIDSAMSAAICVDALGAENVQCIMLPSRYTSEESLKDAEGCAKLLGVDYRSVSISGTVEAAEEALAPLFKDRPPGVTEENIQSRTRGLLLMAISNKFGRMLITTGNKSEVSVGYATLYGDMNGGFNPLKDLYKMQVFALADWRNQNFPRGALGPEGRLIPQNIISKPPTAELREDQKDEDSLPPYETLDAILECLIDREEGVDAIVARGHDRETVKKIEHLVYVAEYKRRQSAPGTKVGPRIFGRDRRYPITNGFRDAR